MTKQNWLLSCRDMENFLGRTHNIKDVSKQVSVLQRRKSQLGLQLKQSKSKIQYLKKRQKIKDEDAKKQVFKFKGKKPNLSWNQAIKKYDPRLRRFTQSNRY